MPATQQEGRKGDSKLVWRTKFAIIKGPTIEEVFQSLIAKHELAFVCDDEQEIQAWTHGLREGWDDETRSRACVVEMRWRFIRAGCATLWSAVAVYRIETKTWGCWTDSPSLPNRI